MNDTVLLEQKLVDQEARDRFTQEIDQNFSIIAPAGVGKTTAIVQRILNIAYASDNSSLSSRLSRLVVVTYTQKAADEMRFRSHQALLKANVSAECLREFGKAFFGTIHSFCLKIIQSYGPQIGISSNVSLLTDDEDLWHEFLSENGSFLDVIPLAIKESLSQYLNFFKLSQLARRIRPELQINAVLPNCPVPDLNLVFNYKSQRSRKVVEIQEQLKHWLGEHQENPFALGLPEISQGDSEFKELCAKAFSPLWHWLGDASLVFVVALARKYQQFRIKKGFISYDDMIGLAAKLLLDPYVVAAVQAQDYYVILDEAQDTDSQQFSVLLGLVGLSDKQKLGKGRFCMLGDPQQAIYGSRADLPTYLRLHRDLVESGALETLTFNVTMRCDKAIVNYCNHLFPSILKQGSTERSQINFIPLNPRPSAQEGFVGKISIEAPEGSISEFNTEALEKHEATVLAQKIHRLGYLGLGITDWSEVAILAPRKSWLMPIAEAFESLDIPTQVHSCDDIKGDNPAVAWVTALLAVMISPNDSFELVGVLREIFGISDDEIATFVSYWNYDKKRRHSLNISRPRASSSEKRIEQVLNLLYHLRKDVLVLSLSEGVRKMIKEVELVERLSSLPDYDVSKLLDSLDKLLIQATLSEEQGLTLEAFADTLIKSYQAPIDSETALKGHVQFYTSHKAKGLEWTVVIVPFLFRSILFPSQEYPQLISMGSDQAPRIAVSDHPDKRKWDDLLDQYRVAELERLLYVTATRARTTLLWVDDEALFQKPKNAFASLLKVTHESVNHAFWNNLSTELPKNLNFKEPKPSVDPIAFDFDSCFDPEILPKAKNESKNFLRRMTPSQCVSKKGSSSLLMDFKSKESDYSFVDYGNWWHKMMETLPWAADKDAWVDHCLKSLTDCPAPVRGESEFRVFLDSPMVIRLKTQAFDVYTEMPFLFKDEPAYFEGFIDFVAYSQTTEELLLIDWKTDLIAGSEALLILKELYLPQLEVYKKVAEQFLKKSSKVFIYSTVLGQWAEI